MVLAAPARRAGRRRSARRRPDLRGTARATSRREGTTSDLAADLAALVRALGAERATSSVTTGAPRSAGRPRPSTPRSCAGCRRSATAPAAVRAGPRTDRAQLRASAYLGMMQVPRLAERGILEDDLVSTLLHRWAAGVSRRRDRPALHRGPAVTGAAHCAAEYYRWAFRSRFRPSGRRFHSRSSAA